VISFAVRDLLVALYFEQISTGNNKVPFSVIDSDYDFGGIRDRLVNGLLDHGLAEPAVFDAEADSAAISLTNEGLRIARDLAKNGHTVKKLSTFSDGAAFSDGSKFASEVPPSDFTHPVFDADAENRAHDLASTSVETAVPDITSATIGTRIDSPRVSATLVSSSRWTGTQYVLVDAEIVNKIKELAGALRVRINETSFSSNSDSHDLKVLADALVGICSMAEPDVSIIDKILANPKFKAYARLMGIIATIRGAIGI
jgi:hypothetical protein